MSAAQLYEQAIKPLSTADKLVLARLILNDIAPDAAEPEYGFEYLKRLLPNIELITVTDEDLANVVLTSPLPE
jgi:hypothetical protein